MRKLCVLILLLCACAFVIAEDVPDSVVAVEGGRATVKPLFKLDYRGIKKSSALQHWQGAWWTLNGDGDGPIVYRCERPDFVGAQPLEVPGAKDRKSTRLNSSHVKISYAVFCLKKKKTNNRREE